MLVIYLLFAPFITFKLSSMQIQSDGILFQHFRK